MADPAPTPDPTTDPAPDPAATADPDPKPDPKPDTLGPNGEKALSDERKARKDAEKQLRDAQAQLKAIEDAKLSETEKLQKQADEGKQLAATATATLQEAKLLLALHDAGITGGRAKAAARLLDDVNYDDKGEPTNLDDALTAAKAAYGDEMFTGATPAPSPDPTTDPDPHQGPRQPSGPVDEEAAFAAIFPQLRSRDELKT